MKAQNYSESREKLKSGDVLAWSGRGFVSRMIRLFTFSTYSHVGIVWRHHGRVFVIEAKEGKGVQVIPLSEVLPTFQIYSGIPWDDTVEGYLMSKVGTKYRYLDALRGWAGIRLKGEVSQCAKLVLSAAKVAGLTLVVTKVTPAEVVTALLKLGNRLRLLEKIT